MRVCFLSLCAGISSCFNFWEGQMRTLQVKKLPSKTCIPHRLSEAWSSMLVSNLSVDSPGDKLFEQWTPLAKFFRKSDSLTLCPGSCGHICGPVGEWNWMQSFPHFPTLQFKWHRVLDAVGGRQEKHCYTLATIFNIVHHPFNTWTADSRELFCRVGLKKDKAPVIFISQTLHVTTAPWNVQQPLPQHAFSCWHLVFSFSQ